MIKTKTVRGRFPFTYAVVVLVGAVGLMAALAAAQDPPLDHFTAYDADGPRPGRTVILDDQFDPFHEVDLLEPIFFMPPAMKNYELINDEYTHLTCYLISPDSPSAWPGGEVDVVNQLGGLEHTLQVLDPVALCVPTQKLWMPWAPLRETHYKCYDAYGAITFIHPPGQVEDQFQLQFLDPDVDPFLFCNPASKTVDNVTYPIANYDDHLTCYFTSPPSFSVIGLVPIDNQFYNGDLDVEATFGLCVPSLKVGVRTFTPAPTDTPIPTNTPTITATSTETQTPADTPTPVSAPTCPTTPL